MKIELFNETKINSEFLWIKISLITLAVAIGICFASIAKLKNRIEALETPAINPYKTQVLFKI